MELLTGKWFDDPGWSSTGDLAVIQYARAYGFAVNVDERTERILSNKERNLTTDDWSVLWALGDQAEDYLNTLAPAGYTAGWKTAGDSYMFGVWED